MAATDEQLYARIEARFGFALPDEYRRMRARGWFTYDAPASDAAYRRPREQAYLWLFDMEWMPLADIDGGDELFFSFSRGGLVPFAFAADASHWCWFPDRAARGVAPVVFCPRDCEDGQFYAPDLLGAMYRQILEFACNVSPDEEREAREHFARWLRDLVPLFPERRQTTVARLAAAPLRGDGLLDDEEYESIVARDLAFPLLDTQFKWTVD